MIHLDPYMTQQDDRGSFLGITTDHWDEVNLVETSAGEVRGNHYHKCTRELFCIIYGEVDVEITHIESNRKEAFTARKGKIFIVEPNELHIFSARTDSQWINMLCPGLDPENMDFHRVEQDS